MSEVVFGCQSCGKAISLAADEKIFRSDECSQCGSDLKCCRNCRFFDPGRNNECAETQAERVVDKTKANYCDYFLPRTKVDLGGGRPSGEDARQSFDDLFK